MNGFQNKMKDIIGQYQLQMGMQAKEVAVLTVQLEEARSDCMKLVDGQSLMQEQIKVYKADLDEEKIHALKRDLNFTQGEVARITSKSDLLEDKNRSLQKEISEVKSRWIVLRTNYDEDQLKFQKSYRA